MFKLNNNPKIPNNLNTAVELVGWIIQIFGVLVLHILLTAGILFGTYAIISTTILSPFWLMYILSIVFIALSFIGIAAVIIDVTNLIHIIRELKNGNYKKELKVIETTCVVVILIIVLVITLISAISTINSRNKTEQNNDTTETNTEVEQYPITDLWVYRYNIQTAEYDLAPCGYLDQYTSIVIKTEETISKVITGSYMYLGTIKGYQNEDKTISVYQIRLPELSENFVLTNDEFVLDFSGNKKMVEITGWIYMDGTTILAVAPLYAD